MWRNYRMLSSGMTAFLRTTTMPPDMMYPDASLSHSWTPSLFTICNHQNRANQTQITNISVYDALNVILQLLENKFLISGFTCYSLFQYVDETSYESKIFAIHSQEEFANLISSNRIKRLNFFSPWHSFLSLRSYQLSHSEHEPFHQFQLGFLSVASLSCSNSHLPVQQLKKRWLVATKYELVNLCEKNNLFHKVKKTWNYMK